MNKRVSSQLLCTGLITAYLSLALAAQAPAEQQHSNEWKQARTLYYQGADGVNDAYERAEKLFAKLYAQQPTDPEIKVYYGSLRLLDASHTWAIWRKNSLSKEGIQLMDSAVDAKPDDLEIRFVRAATTYNLPSFFHRKEQSEDDFNILADKAIAAARAGELEPRLATASLYYHGEFLRSAGNNKGAISAWKSAVQLAPETRGGRESTEALKKIGS